MMREKGKTWRIAFYGKGGIGKSMVSANCAIAMARQGLKVLLIGCDPKADSTRNVMGRRIPSVLQQIREKDTRISTSDILYSGAFGVCCVESGGPQAGVGCAGLGISTAMDTLRQLQILEDQWDAIIYDVLGDVVCGGFAIPMRQGMVDRIYVVTSDEPMALYAANNIVKGVARYQSEEKPLLGGVIQNRIRGRGAVERVQRFTTAIQADYFWGVPQDDQIQRADYLKQTIMEQDPEGTLGKGFGQLVQKLQKVVPGKMACPLDDVAFDSFIEALGREMAEHEVV